MSVRYIVILICTALRLVYDSFVAVYGVTEGLLQADKCVLDRDVDWRLIAILIGTSVFEVK